MFPTYKDEDFVLATRRWRVLLPGDVVIARHPRYKTIIKRVVEVAADGSVRVKGDNAQSVCSDAIGWIKANVILAKVLKLGLCANSVLVTERSTPPQPYHLFHH